MRYGFLNFRSVEPKKLQIILSYPTPIFLIQNNKLHFPIQTSLSNISYNSKMKVSQKYHKVDQIKK